MWLTKGRISEGHVPFATVKFILQPFKVQIDFLFWRHFPVAWSSHQLELEVALHQG